MSLGFGRNREKRKVGISISYFYTVSNHHIHQTEKYSKEIPGFLSPVLKRNGAQKMGLSGTCIDDSNGDLA